ncbi:MAG: endonuclease/exonuclease/phosphatase family protein [Deltaproteobacteria bacterium]|nr:endonuclease/exonuclease/phosphatase family protein [Deltaproteobacteria bacterium]
MGLGFRVHMQLGTWKGPGIAWSVRDDKALRQPDVLGLQEVCLTAGAQLDYLVAAMQAAHPGRRVYHAEATDGGQLDPKCSNAQVTLSVHPILASGRFEFPLLSWRNAAVWADLDIGEVAAYWNTSRRLRVYNLHLINRVGRSVQVPEARWTQTQALLAHYQAFRRSEPDTPVIWLGDFNALGDVLHPWRKERSIVELSKLFKPSLDGYHPTHFLLQQTDWIFADRMAPLRSRVVFLPYSDHFPVVADY